MAGDAPAPASVEGAKGSVEIVEPTGPAEAHARRVAESKATVPHVYLETEAEVDPASATTEAIVKACALALREFPRVNGAYRDGRFELYSRINVGVAVAAQETLLFPTVHDADAKDAAQIGAEIRALAERAREETITQPELSAGTFTMADLGPLGVTRSSAIIPRGQAAILTAGAVRGDGRLTLSLACDNRILQEPEAAGFLARVRTRLEDAASLA